MCYRIHTWKAVGLAVLSMTLLFTSCKKEKDVRLLYWNIQNGMWDGQNDNYDRFVDFVKAQDPDICVWCEAQSIFLTDSDQSMPEEDRYLVENWGELAARYGHQYWGIGGHRDNYPQVITSKYPITYVDKIVGAEPDSVVSHAAGWATVDVKGKTLNIVTLHTWPQAYAYRVENRDSSRAEHGGDKYRAMEMKYICEHTIESVPEAGEQMWMMMGDFNSVSRLDNDKYGFPEEGSRFLVHDYILENTPYVDLIKEWYPDKFKPTIAGKSRRIDFVYCTRPLYDCITAADVIWNEYTSPVRDPQGLSNFWRPSDHLPIMIDFDMGKRNK